MLFDRHGISHYLRVLQSIDSNNPHSINHKEMRDLHKHLAATMNHMSADENLMLKMAAIVEKSAHADIAREFAQAKHSLVQAITAALHKAAAVVEIETVTSYNPQEAAVRVKNLIEALETIQRQSTSLARILRFYKAEIDKITQEYLKSETEFTAFSRNLLSWLE